MGMFDKMLCEEDVAMEDKQHDYVAQVVKEGQDIAERNHWGDKYPMLMAGLESADPSESYRNAYTSILMRNQARFIQRASKQWGESTVSAFLGDTAPRIMDVVRVFAPNTIKYCA